MAAIRRILRNLADLLDVLAGGSISMSGATLTGLGDVHADAFYGDGANLTGLQMSGGSAGAIQAADGSGGFVGSPDWGLSEDGQRILGPGVSEDDGSSSFQVGTLAIYEDGSGGMYLYLTGQSSGQYIFGGYPRTLTLRADGGITIASTCGFNGSAVNANDGSGTGGGSWSLDGGAIYYVGQLQFSGGVSVAPSDEAGNLDLTGGLYVSGVLSANHLSVYGALADGVYPVAGGAGSITITNGAISAIA